MQQPWGNSPQIPMGNYGNQQLSVWINSQFPQNVDGVIRALSAAQMLQLLSPAQLQLVVLAMNHEQILCLLTTMNDQQKTLFTQLINEPMVRGFHGQHISLLLPFMNTLAVKQMITTLRSDQYINLTQFINDKLFLALIESTSPDILYLLLKSASDSDRSVIQRNNWRFDVVSCKLQQNGCSIAFFFPSQSTSISNSNSSVNLSSNSHTQLISPHATRFDESVAVKPAVLPFGSSLRSANANSAVNPTHHTQSKSLPSYPSQCSIDSNQRNSSREDLLSHKHSTPNTQEYLAREDPTSRQDFMSREDSTSRGNSTLREHSTTRKHSTPKTREYLSREDSISRQDPISHLDSTSHLHLMSRENSTSREDLTTRKLSTPKTREYLSHEESTSRQNLMSREESTLCKDSTLKSTSDLRSREIKKESLSVRNSPSRRTVIKKEPSSQQAGESENKHEAKSEVKPPNCPLPVPSAPKEPQPPPLPTEAPPPLPTTPPPPLPSTQTVRKKVNINDYKKRSERISVKNSASQIEVKTVPVVKDPRLSANYRESPKTESIPQHSSSRPADTQNVIPQHSEVPKSQRTSQPRRHDTDVRTSRRSTDIQRDRSRSPLRQPSSQRLAQPSTSRHDATASSHREPDNTTRQQPPTRQSTRPYRWVSSTPAQLYFKLDKKTGTTVATDKMRRLEDKFQSQILDKFKIARKNRAPYKYPSEDWKQQMKLQGNCSHSHEDDSCSSTDSESDSGDGNPFSCKGDDSELKYTPEIEAKLNHPDKLHYDIWYNDKGHLNGKPACRCSRKGKQSGVRHSRFNGETVLKVCHPESNNIHRLRHYRVVVRETVNFKMEDERFSTKIEYDNRQFVFTGWSIFTHQELKKIPEVDMWLYRNYYSLHLIEEMIPDNFTIRSLDMVTDYLVHDLFGMWDLEWVQDRNQDGCRQAHVMPRFTRALPENGEEVLSMNVVLDYLIKSFKPIVNEIDLLNISNMSKQDFLQLIRPLKDTLVTNPLKKPTTIRVDTIENEQDGESSIRWPSIVHFTRRPDEVSYTGNRKYMNLARQRRRLNKLWRNGMIPLTPEDYAEKQSIEDEMWKIQHASELRREVMITVTTEGFYQTGLRSDVTQNCLILPKVMIHIRFHQSLMHLQNTIGYQFNDIKLLQLSLTHPSNVNGFSLNCDHLRNTASNCGLRRPIYGEYTHQQSLKPPKKKGLRRLLQQMSRFVRDGDRGAVLNYERLEFLGDAVLEFIVSVHLFYMFPDLYEGGLAGYRTAIVRNSNLTLLAKRFSLQDYLLYGHGSDLCDNIDDQLADAFEALLGALYLDGGISVSDAVLTRALASELSFDEFFPTWSELPLHPLQEYDEDYDRKLVEINPKMKHLLEFEKMSGITFDHVRLLVRAMTHCSSSYNTVSQGHNQTMEFLGDAVLQLITTDYLYKRYPTHYEGPLTLLRSAIVSNATQSEIYHDLNLNQYILRDMTVAPMFKEQADYVEALLGAIYIDQGLEVCRGVCDVLFFTRLDDIIHNQGWSDPKSQLQQCCLAMRTVNRNQVPDVPVYKTIESKGASNSSYFKVAVYFKGKRLSDGTGSSIHKAQVQAAIKALLGNQDIFHLQQRMTRYYESELHQLHLSEINRKRSVKKEVERKVEQKVEQRVEPN